MDRLLHSSEADCYFVIEHEYSLFYVCACLLTIVPDEPHCLRCRTHTQRNAPYVTFMCLLVPTLTTDLKFPDYALAIQVLPKSGGTIDHNSNNNSDVARICRVPSKR
jgi:hypothetical protein